MYSNVQSFKMSREGENIIWFIKIWWKLFIPSVINCLDNTWGLHHDLKRFWFASWFETILICIMIWNGYNLHHDLKRLWFTTLFVVHISGVPRTDVIGTCQIAYINTIVIPGRSFCHLSFGIISLAFYYIF